MKRRALARAELLVEASTLDCLHQEFDDSKKGPCELRLFLEIRDRITMFEIQISLIAENR